MSTTPILDLEHSPPEPPSNTAAQFVAGLIGFAVVVVPLAARAHLHQSYLPALNPLLLFPAWYVALAVHELGHVLAARLAGLQFGGISIGIFTLIHSCGKWTFRLEWQNGLGGAARSITPGQNGTLGQRAAVVAGGPLASLALVIVAWLRWSPEDSSAWHWDGTFLYGSALLLLVCLLPTASGFTKSDSARLWQFLRHPDATRKWLAIDTILSEDARGVRPRDWAVSTFEQILAPCPGYSEYAFAQTLAYYRRLDEDNDEAALDHLENALAHSAGAGTLMRHAFFQEAAWASAHVRGNAAQAREWRGRACRVKAPMPLHAVDAAIAMCESRWEDGEREWQNARIEADRQRVDSGLCRFAKERWARFEQSCRDARAATNRAGE